MALNAELESWLEMLRSPLESDRLVALKTLQHLGDEAALEPLTHALQDESPRVQKLAVTALWELGNPAAVPALLDLTSPNAEIREEAQSALGELISPEHLLLLLDALQRHDQNLQLSILILLRKIHDIQSLPAIVPFLQSENAELREAAVTTLRYLNQLQQCPPALSLLMDVDERVRRAAALTLGYLVDAEVIYLLSHALVNDRDWQVRRNAAKSLALHANSEALPALGTALVDEHWQVRKAVLQALQNQTCNQHLPGLIRALADEFADVRKEAAIALGNLGNSAALNSLQQALDDPDREVVIYTQRAIQKINAISADV